MRLLITLLCLLCFKAHAQEAPAKPATIEVTVGKNGQWTIDGKTITDTDALYARFREAAQQKPQPMINIHESQDISYEFIGKIIYTAIRAGFEQNKVVFVPLPSAKK